MMHDRHKQWIDARGITPELAEKFGLETIRDGEGFWLTVPYIEAGKVINHKYRMTSEKRHRMDKDAPLALWNVDALSHPEVLAGAPVIITEGEWDALSAIQSGLRHVVSVPNGAPASRTPEPENAKRYEWVFRHIDALDKVKTFVLATDGDTAGQNLASDLIALLGAERCRFVTYPAHCKDLNDVLIHHGHQAVVQIINGARPVPVQGLYSMDDFPEKGEVTAWPTGIAPLGDMIHIVPGTLTVFTGFANMGKSTVMNSVLANLISVNIPVVIASFETDVKPILRDGLRMSLMKCGKHDLQTRSTKEADDLISENVRIITQLVDEDDEMTLENFLEYCRVAVVRDGVKFILLDPWNELEHKRRSGETETDYISRALRAIKRFAKQYDVAFWVVAHPTKPEQGSSAAPKLYNISGCYSDDTEVLTRRGWLRHDQLAHDDEVACFDPETESIAYSVPSRIIRKPFNDEMLRFKGYGYDLLVTPDHRMVVKPTWREPVGSQRTTGIGRPVRWPKDEWSFCEAKNLPSAPFVLPIAASFGGRETGISEDMAALAGWYVSEGCAQSSGVSISQARGDKADQIEALLVAMSLPYSITRSAPGGKGGTLPMQAFYIGVRGARDVVEWLRAECGIGSANKRIPPAILEGLPEVRRAFLMAYLAGDGSYRAKAGTHAACTTSPILRDQLQRLAIELGYSCCWTRRSQASAKHAPSWHLNIGTNGRRETAVRQYRNVSREAYAGYVWCLTVPTGAYIVRRNGKATICGNSANWANKADYGLTYHRPKPDENSAKLIVTKVRMGLPGRKGEVSVSYDFRRSEFVEDQFA